MPSRKTIVVLHLAGQYPMAGVVWQALQYLVGLRQLGHDVFYVEDSGAPPYDPRVKSVVSDATYNVTCLQQALEKFGFAGRWAYWDSFKDCYYGLSQLQLQSLYERTDVILNLCGASWSPAERKRSGKTIYVETDPIFEQIRSAQGVPEALALLAAHDECFTYGENLGEPDCPIPPVGANWKKTRPPVVLDLWTEHVDPSCRFFTTVATWHNRGKDITFQGKTYYWSKHVNFHKFLDLPRHTSQPFELAVETSEPAVREQLSSLGWHLAEASERSATVEGYRDYIYSSRGEFTVAKDIYVRPRSGWFSDRSVCYLAAGKPVVTQETGFSKFIPAGEGVFAFSNMEEAVSALERINADYVHHARAARRVAQEFFAADKVLRKLLQDAGIA
ncbi:MAG: glycosyltransferase family 1 protein [Deltaproteobacteria bacterium]|nr:glycosyltransferase family 1 protein [Deltaproteobacteria bacterium]